MFNNVLFYQKACPYSVFKLTIVDGVLEWYPILDVPCLVLCVSLNQPQANFISLYWISSCVILMDIKLLKNISRSLVTEISPLTAWKYQMKKYRYIYCVIQRCVVCVMYCKKDINKDLRNKKESVFVI